jgi:hypothetical protein
VLDGALVLALEVDEEHPNRAATLPRLVGDEVQHDGGVLAGAERDVHAGEVVERPRDPLPGRGEDVDAEPGLRHEDGLPRLGELAVLERFGEAGDLREAQHLVGVHAELAADLVVGPVAPLEVEHDVRHGDDLMLTAGAVVADRRRDAVARSSRSARICTTGR